MIRITGLGFGLGLAAVWVFPNAHAASQQYNGYAILTEPPVATDLAQTVYRTVHGATVGQGLYEILTGTGYRLAEPRAADPAIGRLYVQPYPEAQRDVGPVELGIAPNAPADAGCRDPERDLTVPWAQRVYWCRPDRPREPADRFCVGDTCQ